MDIILLVMFSQPKGNWIVKQDNRLIRYIGDELEYGLLLNVTYKLKMWARVHIKI